MSAFALGLCVLHYLGVTVRVQSFSNSHAAGLGQVSGRSKLQVSNPHSRLENGGLCEPLAGPAPDARIASGGREMGGWGGPFGTASRISPLGSE